MKKVGILGGTFDPPHRGHLQIAHAVHEALSLDEIWFMPNKQPPHKEMTSGVSDENRVDMIQLSIKGNDAFKLETIELKRPGRSYTYDTMNLLLDKYRTHQFYFIIGADMIEYLAKWYKIDELIQRVKFVGVNRPHYKKETVYPVINVEMEAIDVSSSNVRQRLALGKSVAHLLPDEVTEYIKENELYGTSSSFKKDRRTTNK